MCQVVCKKEQLKNEYWSLSVKNETDLLLVKINYFIFTSGEDCCIIMSNPTFSRIPNNEVSYSLLLKLLLGIFNISL